MTPDPICVTPFLEHHSVRTSAPARVDCGATWDLKALALVKENWRPSTVNLAVDLRTTVELLPYDREKIYVESDGFGEEERSCAEVCIRSRLGLIFAIASHFNVSGIKIRIQSQIPKCSGMGGSGTVAVGVIAALSQTLTLMGESEETPKDSIAVLAHNIEDGLGISLTGLQDQLAAVHGGINKWTWYYSRCGTPYERQVLLRESECADMEQRMLVAFTGEDRASASVSMQYVDGFLRGHGLDKWRRIRDIAEEFAGCICRRDWLGAAAALHEDGSLREEILPGVITPLVADLRRDALQSKCGANTCGGNRAGSVWAIGDIDSVSDLRNRWNQVFANHGRGKILVAPVARDGLRVEIQ